MATGLVFAAASPQALAQQTDEQADDDLLDGIDDAPTTPVSGAREREEKDEAEAASARKRPAKKKPIASSDDGAEPADTSPGTIDRIKAVPKKPLLKRRRLELAPMASLSVNDPYYQHFAVSGELVYYPHDAMGIGFGLDWLYAHVRSDAVDVVRHSQTSVLAEFVLPSWFGHVDFHWAPLYGKLSLFDSFIVHFDSYFTVGFGLAKTGERYPPGAHIAIGQRYRVWDWLALRLELRDHFFIDKQEVNGQERSDVQSYVMLLVGASFFVPPSFEYTYR